MNLTSDTVLAAFNASLQVLPLLIPQWRWPFAPRQVTDGRDLLPLLLAPWSAPSHIHPGIVLSRLLQAIIFFTRIPSDFHLAAYPLWIVLALIRTQLGYLLTRSAGWAFPSLFRHWALYEETSGMGPIMVIYFYMTGVPEGMPVEEGPFLVLLSVLFGWLDNAPWTYSLAIAIGLALSFIFRVAFTEQRSLPTPSIPPSFAKFTPADMLKYRVGLVSLLLLTCPYGLYNLFYTPPSIPVASLDIVILSFPRPGPDSDSFLSTTIASFVPHISENISLSVFTHANGFAAFTAAQSTFSDVVTFHADADQHPVEQWGQYLHLAEALKWAKGEWVMLIEDDFPLCPGGWGAIELVMAGMRPGQAGFVGTGGSGLIMHRSQLNILSDLLRLNAQNPVEWRKPPDVVMQECLLGVSGLCRGMLNVDGLGRGMGGGDDGGMIITSRLVLDHIGGMASTTLGKPGNTDKWRCGWRHAFHGKRGVEVVVV
ncbi:hypothetical protein BDZ89DRAFT_1070797 [Hymenopellis radicata]|nr:hypothetical protein BDZ89DRAFT_1070797 [Hymenopellis radicata]